MAESRKDVLGAQPAAAGEAAIVCDRNRLVVLTDGRDETPHRAALRELTDAFCGDVTVLPRAGAAEAALASLTGATVYLCGDLAATTTDANPALASALSRADWVAAVREHCTGLDGWGGRVVGAGRVPRLVAGVGVFYPEFFEEEGHFERITAEHEFQELTESTKPGTAHRTGIYLTPVARDDHDGSTHFRLLRCSSNLSGPTDNFRATDHAVVGALNEEAKRVFDSPAELNHVLAQVYHNKAADPAAGRAKDTKAKIAPHSDKTKDMPTNAIMAFTTFYVDLSRVERMVAEGDAAPSYDYGHKGLSALTRLHFALKRPQKGLDLPKSFSVPLYPNSVFMIPLWTNRVFTHEIRPSALGADRIPTRLGYVVRCSNAEAVHRGGETFLKAPGGRFVRLEPPSHGSMSELRDRYYEENRFDKPVNYGKVPFSFNRGDYEEPIA